MTEIICPTCGSRCKVVEEDCGKSMTVLVSRYKPLPQPDLTKLREVFKELINVCTDPNLMCLNRYSKVHMQIDNVIRAVKELLEENKL